LHKFDFTTALLYPSTELRILCKTADYKTLSQLFIYYLLRATYMQLKTKNEQTF